MSAEAQRIEGAPLIRPSSTDHSLYDDVVAACRTVYDPEIPVNIFDLGLVYTIEISDAGAVTVIMSLTAPGCPVAGEHGRDGGVDRWSVHVRSPLGGEVAAELPGSAARNFQPLVRGSPCWVVRVAR
jgi:hypothetical protein